MKPSIPIMIILMLVSTNIIGISNQAEKLKAQVQEKDKLLDKLAFYCYGVHGIDTTKHQYYKTKLLQETFIEDVNEDEVEPQSIVFDPIIVLGSPPMDSAWSTKCHDNRHTGRSPYSTTHIDGLEKWRYKAVDWVNAGIVISDNGTIYFGEIDRYIYAVNPDGTEKWKFGPTGGWTTSTPALAEDGTLYVTNWDNRLYALNSIDGTQIWIFNAGDTITSSPIIALDGTIYFGVMGPGNDKGRIYAVNPNGTEKWHYDTGYWIASDPAIGDDGTIYCGSSDNHLYALNPNGTLKWRYKTGSEVKGPPSISDDGTVYVGSFDGYLYAFYPNNGTVKWKNGAIESGTSTNPSLAEDGTIYVGGNDLYAIYPNGTRKWAFDPGNQRTIQWSSPAISADGTIYFGTNIGDAGGGEIISVNPDGTENWRKKVARYWVDSSPCIGEDGSVYIGSAVEMGRGYLHAFGPVNSNSPPETPTISGKKEGEINKIYELKINAVDPDNNPISFYIDWGDGIEGWQSERASGENCYYGHKWNKRGKYTIGVKAKDTLGEESDWAYLEVTMPKTKQSTNWWLLQFLEQHPRMFPILRQFLGLK